AWASHLLSEAHFGDQPLGWPVAGTVDSVQELKRDDLMNHIGTWYVPRNIVLSVAGNTTQGEVLKLARKLLAEAEGGPAPAIPTARDGIPERNVIVEDRDITQSNMAMALRTVSRRDPDRSAVTIMNTVLGRGMSSRLFKEVRERRGLAYSIGSGVSLYNDTGVLTISAGVSADKVAETTSVIKAELTKLVEEPVGEEELTKSRDYIIGNFRLSMETPMALAQRAGDQLLMLGEIESIDDVVARYQAVTAADVQRVAKRIFRKDNFSMSLVGPGANEGELTELLAA
ncbi:MAG: insulinase family protein, partial [Chloroflexi bacterium]|nr:insulinase family protein [Chloroflexota bacterium]